eukprot:364627-Chlamydomonas_euryale.AAC.2
MASTLQSCASIQAPCHTKSAWALGSTLSIAGAYYTTMHNNAPACYAACFRCWTCCQLQQRKCWSRCRSTHAAVLGVESSQVHQRRPAAVLGCGMREGGGCNDGGRALCGREAEKEAACMEGSNADLGRRQRSWRGRLRWQSLRPSCIQRRHVRSADSVASPCPTDASAKLQVSAGAQPHANATASASAAARARAAPVAVLGQVARDGGSLKRPSLKRSSQVVCARDVRTHSSRLPSWKQRDLRWTRAAAGRVARKAMPGGFSRASEVHISRD